MARILAIVVAWVLSCPGCFRRRNLAIIISSAMDPPVSWLESVYRIWGLSVCSDHILIVALIAHTIVPLAILKLTIFINFNKASNAIFDILQSSKAIDALNKSLSQL